MNINKSKIDVYRRGFKMEPVRKLYPHKRRPGKKQKIKFFSDGSARRLGKWYMQFNWKSMITLTYHAADGIILSPEQSKNHLESTLHLLRRKNIKFLWVLEFQSRGVPHYHIWMDREFDDIPLWEDELGSDSWRPIMKRWLKTTGQKDDKKCYDVSMHQGSFTNWNVTVHANYAKKYAIKQQQKGLPKGLEVYGRWWGKSRSLQIVIDSFTVDLNDPVETKKGVACRRFIFRYLEKVFKCKFAKNTRDYSTIGWVMNELRINDLMRIIDYFLRYEPDFVPF